MNKLLYFHNRLKGIRRMAEDISEQSLGGYCAISALAEELLQLEKEFRTYLLQEQGINFNTRGMIDVYPPR